jgi:hypothetical protein
MHVQRQELQKMQALYSSLQEKKNNNKNKQTNKTVNVKKKYEQRTTAR